MLSGYIWWPTEAVVRYVDGGPSRLDYKRHLEGSPSSRILLKGRCGHTQDCQHRIHNLYYPRTTDYPHSDHPHAISSTIQTTYLSTPQTPVSVDVMNPRKQITSCNEVLSCLWIGFRGPPVYCRLTSFTVASLKEKLNFFLNICSAGRAEDCSLCGRSVKLL